MAKYHLNRVVTNAIFRAFTNCTCAWRFCACEDHHKHTRISFWNLQDGKAILANASAQRRLHCAQPCLSVRIPIGPRRIFWRDARKYHLRPYCVTMLSQFYRTLLPFSNRPWLKGRRFITQSYDLGSYRFDLWPRRRWLIKVEIDWSDILFLPLSLALINLGNIGTQENIQ